jgi:ubiquinone/menaquinone biosynthesis C-methylase UbiE
MSNLPNQNDLRDDQYKDATNLNARVQLHARFSLNHYGWHRFVFDRLSTLPAHSHILEVGCGPALLWKANSARIEDSWHVTLSDFSPGMVEEAKRSLATNPQHFNFEVLDAQAILFPEATFDTVIANHMLYHVPDRPRAIAEMHRVLKSGGRLLAATNGQNHMRELGELGRRFGLDIDFSFSSEIQRFSLETGEAQLAAFFPEVNLHRYEDGLEITEVQPILDYIFSVRSTREILVGENLAEITKYLEEEIAQKGAFYVTKDAGLLVATK